jgi:hypothetical protein
MFGIKLKTIRAEVVGFGRKPKLMKCRFEVTHFYDLLTYLKTATNKLLMLIMSDIHFLSSFSYITIV